MSDNKTWYYPQHKNNVCPQYTGPNGDNKTGLDGISYVSEQSGSLRISCGIDHPRSDTLGNQKWQPYNKSGQNMECPPGKIELKDLSNGPNGAYKCLDRTNDLPKLQNICSNIKDHRGFSYQLILDEDNVHRCAWIPKSGMNASFETPKQP